MKAEILKLGRNGLYYGIAMVASKAAGFLMLPVYTRYLTPADYGVAELLMATLDVVSIVVGLGITAAIFKVRADYRTEAERNAVFSTALSLMLIVFALTALIGFLFAPSLSGVVFGHRDYAGYFRILFITLFLQQGFIAIALMFIRAQENARLFMAVSLCKLAFQIVANVTALVFFDMGLLGLLLSGMLAETVVSLYLIASIGRKVGFRIEKDKARALFRFGFPFVFTTLGSFALVFGDRYFLNVYTDLTTIGIYTLAYKIGFMLVFLTVMPFQQVWEPQRFRISETSEAERTFQRVFLYLNSVLLSAGLTITLFAREVLMVMSDASYWGAQTYVPWIVLAYVFHTWAFFCDFGLQKTGRSGRIAQISLLSAAIVLTLLYWLVPKFGVYGALISLNAAYLFRFALIYIFSKRAYRLDYGMPKAGSLLLFATALGAAGLSLPAAPFGTVLAIKAGLVLLFIWITYLVFLSRQEQRFIYDVLKRPFLRRSST